MLFQHQQFHFASHPGGIHTRTKKELPDSLLQDGMQCPRIGVWIVQLPRPPDPLDMAARLVLGLWKEFLVSSISPPSRLVEILLALLAAQVQLASADVVCRCQDRGTSGPLVAWTRHCRRVSTVCLCLCLVDCKCFLPRNLTSFASELGFRDKRKDGKGRTSILFPPDSSSLRPRPSLGRNWQQPASWALPLNDLNIPGSGQNARIAASLMRHKPDWWS